MLCPRSSCLFALLLLACRSEPEPRPVGAEQLETQPVDGAPEPEHLLIRHACRGFEAAVAEGAPGNQLLATSAKHAIELGGPAVEAATTRWALLPPQGLLELIDRYEAEARPDPQQCAGLRAHLERMSLRVSTH
ncbi:MAG: hypothetical protein R6X02_33705 [Enhygromyxa sp.]